MKDQYKNILGVIGIIFLILAAVLMFFLIKNEMTRTAYIGLESGNLPVMRLQGEGVTQVVPNRVEMSLAVITEGEESEAALEENNRQMEQVVSYLKDQGVEEANIQTGEFSVRPVHDWVADSETGERRRVISGYLVSNRVDVKVTDMEKAGTITDGAVQAGANEVTRFDLVVSDEEEYKKEARREAIREAREKAEEIAYDLGVELGRVISFSEDTIHPFVTRSATEAMDVDDPRPQVPIEPGEEEIKVNVTVGFELKQR